MKETLGNIRKKQVFIVMKEIHGFGTERYWVIEATSVSKKGGGNEKGRDPPIKRSSVSLPCGFQSMDAVSPRTVTKHGDRGGCRGRAFGGKREMATCWPPDIVSLVGWLRRGKSGSNRRLGIPGAKSPRKDRELHSSERRPTQVPGRGKEGRSSRLGTRTDQPCPRVRPDRTQGNHLPINRQSVTEADGGFPGQTKRRHIKRLPALQLRASNGMRAV